MNPKWEDPCPGNPFSDFHVPDGKCDYCGAIETRTPKRMKPMNPKNIKLIDDTPLVQETIQRINRVLEEPWSDDEIRHGRRLGFKIEYKIWVAVERAFRAEGWYVNRRDDQREGTSYTFKPRSE